MAGTLEGWGCGAVSHVFQIFPDRVMIPHDRRTFPARIADALTLTIAAAMVACWGHLAVSAVMRHVFGLFSWKWWLRDQLMLSSIGYLLVIGALSLVPIALHTIWPRRVTLAILAAFQAALTAFAVLLLAQRIAPWALSVVALAAAVQLHRWARAREDALRRASRRLALAGVTASALVVSSLHLVRARAEARDMAALADAPAGTPNVLLIILDTVRASGLGLLGGPFDNTPHLAEWARRGVTFERAYSTASWTLPSHASMFTGEYASHAGADWSVPLDAGKVTLAEVFRDRGLATGGFVANTVAAVYRTGLSQGFIRYEDTPRSLAEFALSTTLTQTKSAATFFLEWKRSGWLRGAAKRAMPLSLVPHGNYVQDDLIPAGAVANSFLQWQVGLGGRPFFAFLNLFDAHAPYVPPERYRTMYGANGRDIDRYHGAIRYMDDEIDRLLRTLDARGVLRNTIVVVTSDHGESFGEHKLVGHGNGLYLNQIHVPLVIVSAPGLPAGVRVHRQVSLRDLAATILDYSGLGKERPLGGRSLRPVIAGDSAAVVSPVIAEVNKGINVDPRTLSGSADQKSVVTDSLHVIQGSQNSLSVFAHRFDPLEERDLSAEPPARAAGLGLMTRTLEANDIRWRAPR